MEIVRALACRHVSHLSYNNNNNSCSNNNGSQENSKDKYNLTNNFASPFPFLSELPSEVLVNIFSFLKSKELCTVALVCVITLSDTFQRDPSKNTLNTYGESESSLKKNGPSPSLS